MLAINVIIIIKGMIILSFTLPSMWQPKCYSWQLLVITRLHLVLSCHVKLETPKMFLPYSILLHLAMSLSNFANSIGVTSLKKTLQVSMKSSNVFAITRQLWGSLWRTTFCLGVFGSLQKNTCWTCEGNAKGSSNSCKKC